MQETLPRFLAYLPYAALGILVAGLAWRLARILRTPQPLPLALTPGPASPGQARLRLARELLYSPTLWRGSPALWFVSGLFHICLLLVGLRHLRYFFAPLPFWLAWLQTPGVVAGYLLPLCLLGLLLRRLGDPRLLLLSRPRHWLALGLLLALSLSGLSLRLLDRMPLHQVKAYTLGLLQLQPPPVPEGLVSHLLLALALLALYPWGSLPHGLFLLFNPVWGRPYAPGQAAAVLPAASQSPLPELGDQPSPDGRRYWDEARYQAYLRGRWSQAGMGRVLGARERAASLGQTPGLGQTACLGQTAEGAPRDEEPDHEV